MEKVRKKAPSTIAADGAKSGWDFFYPITISSIRAAVVLRESANHGREVMVKYDTTPPSPALAANG